MLTAWGIDNVDGFIEVTHYLGLNDTLWVKPANSSLHWDEVSLVAKVTVSGDVEVELLRLDRIKVKKDFVKQTIKRISKSQFSVIGEEKDVF